MPSIEVTTQIFPSNIAYGTTGGPRFNTDVEELDSGQISTNAHWGRPRYEYDAAHAVVNQATLAALVNFFNAFKGRSKGFLFKDYVDFSSASNGIDTPSGTDQTLGTGDGVTANFQIVKVYTQGSEVTTRYITRPKSGTVKVAVDTVLKTENTHYTVDYTTGVITFDVSYIPTSGQVVTAGYEFYVPVMFGIDRLEFVLETYELHKPQTVPLFEIWEDLTL